MFENHHNHAEGGPKLPRQTDVLLNGSTGGGEKTASPSLSLYF